MLGLVSRGVRAFLQGVRDGIAEHRRAQAAFDRGSRAGQADAARILQGTAAPDLGWAPPAPGVCHANGEARLPSAVSPLRPEDAILVARGVTAETCASCRFFHRPLLECRRYAPGYEDDGSGEHTNATAVWPEVLADDWCGDHVPAFRSTVH